MRFRRLLLRAVPVFALLACGPGTPPPPDGESSTDASVNDAVADAAPRNMLETVPLSTNEHWELPGLRSQAYVLRTEGNIPHIYASNRADLARVQGFVVARDRFFVMDMARRLALGTVSSLFGDVALENDLRNRATGMTFVADQILRNLTPAQAEFMDAFAEGVNSYLAAVRARRIRIPQEYELAGLLFGVPGQSLVQNFERRDMAAVFATFVYQLGYETEDVGHGRTDVELETAFATTALGMLRRAGARQDIFERIVPLRELRSAAGFGMETESSRMSAAPAGENRRSPPRVQVRERERRVAAQQRIPASMLAHLETSLEAQQHLLGRWEGFGSNAWAVNRRGTTDGSAVIASDGHLPLSSPPLFYTIGLDTEYLGGGDMHIVGVTIPGLPMVAVGTNGALGWGETQLGNDNTDWYREELVLGSDGFPTHSRFRGENRPLNRVEETFVVADVPALNSRGRTERIARWTTFDGRFITEIEGRTVRADEMLRPGEVRVHVMGRFVVPMDMDGDGKITALSFDYTALDGGNLIGVYDGWNRARTVQEFREWSRGLLAASQNYIAADSTGSIYYTGYQPTPCRNYLERNPDRTWARGSDPTKILDGTRYGGFTIPLRDGRANEEPGRTDPYQCLVPFDRFPTALDPTRGYVFTANNDPGGLSFDNQLWNDEWYLGGPWLDGYRADRINRGLQASVTARNADLNTMAALQADTYSNVGSDFVGFLLEGIERARTVAMQPSPPMPGTEDARIVALYSANREDFEEVYRRLNAWRMSGFRTPSGVETFYHRPDPSDREPSVATTIFNTWMGRFARAVWDDEPFPGGTFAQGTLSRLRSLRLLLEGRGTTNTRQLASWNMATGESAFFDRVGTEAVETSREVMLTSLVDALTYLRSAPTAGGNGGYGTRDWNQWLWGLRHRVHFDSILNDFLGDNPMLSSIAERFSVTTRQLPLADNLMMNDPRFGLLRFPRPGDQYSVDAANSGLSGEGFDYGSGPVFRMVISMGPNGVRAQNILPGGESGDPRSMYFSDQTRRWLANQTLPMLLTPREVVANARGREDFVPAAR